MHLRSFVTAAAILVMVTLAGCHRETPDEDMAAATATTPTTGTETSGTLSATTTASTGGSVSAMSPADKEFVIQAAYVGMAEVAFGQLALSTAQGDQIKTFAQMMITDHGQDITEMQRIATVKGLALPTGLDQSHQKTLDQLRSETAANFDRAYAAQMVEDHEKAVALFGNAERSLQDPDVKGWVSGKLPRLRQHLEQARALNSASQ